MKPSDLQLLSLPREIRDMIYAHLTNNLSFHWGYKSRGFPVGGHFGAKVEVKSAPLLPVLLTCTQIYDEYRCSLWSRKLRMVVDDPKGGLFRLKEGTESNAARFEKLCKIVPKIEMHCQSQYMDREAAEIFIDLNMAIDELLKEYSKKLECHFDDEVSA